MSTTLFLEMLNKFNPKHTLSVHLRSFLHKTCAPNGSASKKIFVTNTVYLHLCTEPEDIFRLLREIYDQSTKKFISHKLDI